MVYFILILILTFINYWFLKDTSKSNGEVLTELILLNERLDDLTQPKDG